MSVVAGIEAFRKAMSGHERDYVLIGGGACSILFDEAGKSFRLTKDLDIVVLVDDCDPSFSRALWDFIHQGGYEAARRKEGACTYYRFDLPATSPFVGKFPGEIELFSRHPDFALMDETTWIAPLHFDDVVSSLSAIILDDGYYEFIKNNTVSVRDIPLLDALHIIPLKMRAHIDNNRLHREGTPLNEKTLRKHRRDVMLLAGLLPQAARLALEGRMREDAVAFLDDLAGHASRVSRKKERRQIEETQGFLAGVYL